ncbi:MAG TPA: Flp family type IVb pilin [Vicinamibacterales bacterium]
MGSVAGAPRLPPPRSFLERDFFQPEQPPMQQVFVAVRRLVRHDDGQDLLEYGLLMVLIAILAIGAVTALGQTINSVFWSNIAQNF